MGVKKVLPLFKGEQKKNSDSDCSLATENKLIVENLIKTIQSKIKDPEMAKKAAQLISELVKEKTNSKKK
ncbi:MAG: hypothetical protein HN509_10905 [Halobacteriovoraceae bacterium]|jgi:hypothetical protein|nr:hypothetical protein [Halobacteriovoraceae bacterium]MBT5096098.1 hypothetical protein [Halobacteriovoraceae bacterium]